MYTARSGRARSIYEFNYCKQCAARARARVHTHTQYDIKIGNFFGQRLLKAISNYRFFRYNCSAHIHTWKYISLAITIIRNIKIYAFENVWQSLGTWLLVWKRTKYIFAFGEPTVWPSFNMNLTIEITSYNRSAVHREPFVVEQWRLARTTLVYCKMCFFASILCWREGVR